MDNIVIADNNADTELQKYGNPFGSRSNGTDYTSTFTLNIPLPKNFSWHIVSKDDSKARKKIKEKILFPVSQGKCGNCYAFATCSVLSDLFLIKYGLSQNPDISPSYLNIHYNVKDKMEGCAGGSPVGAIQQIILEGAVSNKCVDNSICLKDKSCNGLSQDNSSTKDLNTLYTSVGDSCYVNKKDFKDEHDRYFPNKDKNSSEPYYKIYPNYDDKFSQEILGTATNVSDFIKETGTRMAQYPKTWDLLRGDQLEVMKQIYRNGPAIGMTQVLNILMQPFFKHADFENVFDGLFFDSVVWDDSGKYTFQNPQLVNCNITPPENYSLQFDGGHAIAIVGYGVSEKEIPLMDFNTGKIIKIKNIPFWWVRNSWGQAWNPTYKGFFKLPMYPFNKVIQVDVPIGQHTINNLPASIPSPYTKDKTGMGGILFIEAGDIKEYTNHESNAYYKKYPNFTSDRYINTDRNYYEISNLDFVVSGGVMLNADGKALSGQALTNITSGKYSHSKKTLTYTDFFLIGVVIILIIFIVYKYKWIRQQFL